jgi:uncharacterized membrane protein
MPGQETVRDRDFERFLTFLDAVVAIAITLLVLPLVDVASEVTSRSDVAEVLRAHVGQFVAFGISFWVISRLWFVQHAVLKPVVASNRRLSALLMLWLANIVVLPFTTALIAQAGHSALVQALYLGSLALGSFLMAGVSTVALRNPALRDGPPADPADSVVVALIFLLVLVLTQVAPALSFWPLVLLYAGDPVTARWRKWRGPLPE